MPPNVVVLGCGLGGLAASDALSRQLGNRAMITVVEPREKIPFPPAFQWVAFGWRLPNKIEKDLKRVAKRKNVRFLTEKVEKIAVKDRTVKTVPQEIQYDKLVVALGAQLTPNEIPGLDLFSHNPYSLEGALKLRTEIQNFNGRSIAVGISRLPIKCPPAPYELALLLEEHFRQAKKSVEIQFFTPEPHPVPAAGGVIGKQVERLLTGQRIKYLPKMKLAKLEKDRALFDGGTELRADLFIIVPPHHPPQVVTESALTDSTGWIPVNPQNLATKYEDVYAIGDVTSIETPHGHAPFLPKSGTFAQGQAETVANNIALSITGKGQAKLWDGQGACYLQTSKSECAFLRGSFLSNPPRLEFHPPRRKWYLDMVKMEKDWLS